MWSASVWEVSARFIRFVSRQVPEEGLSAIRAQGSSLQPMTLPAERVDLSKKLFFSGHKCVPKMWLKSDPQIAARVSTTTTLMILGAQFDHC